jgi:8-oxo-dGTP diphosphatase
MKKAVVAGVLVKNGKEEYLLVKKPDGVGPYAGTYLTPGGHVNDGESVESAALRELFEETGVKVTNLEKVMFDDDFTANWSGEMVHLIMMLYRADYVSGDLQPTEGDDDNLEVIKWFTLQEIRNLKLSPPLRKLLEYLQLI